MPEHRELGQAEIDALLSGLVPVVDLGEGPTDPELTSQSGGIRAKSVKLYDFRRPDKLSKDQVRTLHLLHQNLARLMSSALSAKARVVVQANLTMIEQKRYREYIDQITEPSALTIVAMDPLPGRSIIEISLDIGYLIVDRLLGGPGKPMPRGRNATEIEMSLLKSVVNSLLFSLTDIWSGIIDFKLRLEDTSLNPQFVQVALPSDIVAVITFEVRIMGVTGSVTLCIPHSVLEPIIPQLSAESLLSRKATTDMDQLATITQHVNSLQVPVAAQLGETRLSVSELLDLEVGDVLSLDQSAFGALDILVEGRPKFRARPGTNGSRMAVQITEVLADEDD